MIDSVILIDLINIKPSERDTKDNHFTLIREVNSVIVSVSIIGILTKDTFKPSRVIL